jgi:hypothetical protein
VSAVTAGVEAIGRRDLNYHFSWPVSSSTAYREASRLAM